MNALCTEDQAIVDTKEKAGVEIHGCIGCIHPSIWPAQCSLIDYQICKPVKMVNITKFH